MEIGPRVEAMKRRRSHPAGWSPERQDVEREKFRPVVVPDNSRVLLSVRSGRGSGADKIGWVSRESVYAGG